MFIPNKDEFTSEIKEIKSKEIKELLLKIYDEVEEGKGNSDDVIKVIDYLFPKRFTKDNMIPYNFIFTPIGIVLFMALFSNANYCSMNDVIDYSVNYAGKKMSRQYLNEEVKQGNLPATKFNGRWIFRKEDVKQYFENK